MRAYALLILMTGLQVKGYGEGHAPVHPHQSRDNEINPSLTWFGPGIRDCGVLWAGAEVEASVVLTLPADATELENPSADVCVHLLTTSDIDAAWWYLVPPKPGVVVRFCADASEAGLVVGAPSLKELVVPVQLGPLPPGYTRAVAWLSQPRHSTTRLVPAAEAIFAVQQPTHPTQGWEGSGGAGAAKSPSVPTAESNRLAAAFREARSDELGEFLEYQARVERGKAIHSPADGAGCHSVWQDIRVCRATFPFSMCGAFAERTVSSL